MMVQSLQYLTSAERVILALRTAITTGALPAGSISYRYLYTDACQAGDVVAVVAAIETQLQNSVLIVIDSN